MARTPTGTTPPPATDQRTCPHCGRGVLETSIRCRFCMFDLRGTRRTGVPRVTSATRRRFPQIRHRWTRQRGFIVIFIAVVLFYGGRWAWEHHISTPALLPVGTSPAISLLEAPSAIWPTPNGGLSQNRVTGARPALGGEVAWQISLPEMVLRAPVADEDRIYITYRDSFGAYSVEDGSEVWQIAQPGLLSSPAIVGDRLYLALRSGRVFGIEAATGELEWTTVLDEEVFTTPIVFGGVVYVYAPGRIHGIDAENGDWLWSRDIEGNFGEVSPVVDEHHIVLAARKAVVILDRETGRRTFRHPHTSTSGLVFGDGFVYSISPSFAAGIDPESTLPWWEGTRLYWNWLWALSAAPRPPRPEVEWVSRERPSELRSGTAFTLMFKPVFDGERIITSDTTGLVRAFDGTTGVLAWETLLAAVHGPSTATPDGLLVPLAGSMALLDLESGEVLDERQLDAVDVVGTRVKRWVVVVDQGTFVVDAPGSALALRE